jgi:hypothetical protein
LISRIYPDLPGFFSRTLPDLPGLGLIPQMGSFGKKNTFLPPLLPAFKFLAGAGFQRTLNRRFIHQPSVRQFLQ